MSRSARSQSQMCPFKGRPHTSRFFVGRQKIFSSRLVCGEFRKVCDKIGACQPKSDSARSQNVFSGHIPARENQQQVTLGKNRARLYSSRDGFIMISFEEVSRRGAQRSQHYLEYDKILQLLPKESAVSGL